MEGGGGVTGQGVPRTQGHVPARFPCLFGETRDPFSRRLGDLSEERRCCADGAPPDPQ